MVVWSALVHAGALGLALVSPDLRDREPPTVIAVELVAPAPPAAPAAPKPAPAPPPEVVPAPPPPPPPPEPKAIVLPEKQTAPKPKEKPKEKPKPREEVFKEPPKKQEKSLDDLLAEMRGSEPAQPAPAQPVETAVVAPSGEPSQGSGEAVPPEVLAWHNAVKRQMRGIWIVPPGFRTQPLATRVVVTLDATGNIVGTPRITKKSGNPWYDDGVLRGLAKASPLPPPPEAGDWPMTFEPGDSY
jgi:outer membrane biosynthesis protein TonB